MSAAIDFVQQQVIDYRKLCQAWYDNPVLYARQRLGISLTWQQREILEAIKHPGAKVSVRSGHGIGKTGACGTAIFWFMETRPFSKVPCTAPTASQLRDVLWAEMAKLQRLADQQANKMGLPDWLNHSALFEITRDRVLANDAREEWYAVARTSGRNNPDALQGFHATEVTVSEDGSGIEEGEDECDGKILFVIEEASGVYEPVFQVAEGALSSHGARLLMPGNPTKNSGYFADSHKHGRGQFTALHFKSDDSPLVSPEYRQRLVRKYGEGSNVVRVRADGEFPKHEDDVLIPIDACEQAITQEKYEENCEIRLGVDVARYGDDRTVYTVRQGRNLLHIKIDAKKSTMEVAGTAKYLRNKFDCARIFVDVIGVGGGVVDRLRELGENVVEVNVSNSAPLRSGSDEQGRIMRDHIWIEMRDWMLTAPSFADVEDQIAQDLAGELASVKFKFDSDGRIKVESKDDMKKRLGNSPDIADSLGCTFGDAGSEILIG